MGSQQYLVTAAILAAKVVGLVVLVQIARGTWWLVNLLFVQPPSDPLRHLQGPDGSKMQNHFRDLME